MIVMKLGAICLFLALLLLIRKIKIILNTQRDDYKVRRQYLDTNLLILCRFTRCDSKRLCQFELSGKINCHR